MKEIIKKILREAKSKWTEDSLKDIASKYGTKGEFLKYDKNAYQAAQSRGKDFFNIITSHMKPTERQVQSGFWTFDNIKKEAEKYKTRNDFKKNAYGAFQKAQEMGWYDEVTKHMPEAKNKKLNTQLFIDKSKTIHGDSYDYSLVDYKKSDEKVKIICRKHNIIFDLQPQAHLQGQGCRLCGYEDTANKNRDNTKNFIQKSKTIHGDKYGYDKVDYEGAHKKVIVVCPKHGDFKVTPNHHLSSQVGCPICKESKGESFIRNYFINKNVKFIQQKKFSDCKGLGNTKCRQLPFDFYLPKFNTLIEYDGRQHTQPVYGIEQLEIQKKIDNIKNDYAKKNNIILIRIPFIASQTEIKEIIDSLIS